MTNRFYQLALLALLATFAFSLNIWGYDLWAPDEPRFAQVGREVLQSGDWLVMRINGEPYEEKPPLLFWMIAAVSAPFGDVSAGTARLPSVLGGIITVLCTFWLASKLYGDRVAWWSAIVLITCQRFWWQARFGQIDMVLTACLAVALLAFWYWDTMRQRRWLFLFYAATALGMFAKGPVVLLFTGLLVVFYYWGSPEERRETHLAVGFLAVVACILFWFVPANLAASRETAVAADTAMASNLFRQIIGRIFLGVSKAQSPTYYFIHLPIDLLPWSLLLPWTIGWAWHNRRDGAGMRLLLSWTVPAFAAMSIIIGKRQIYLLPLYPGFAILIARSAIALADSGRIGWRKWIAALWALILILLAVAPLAIPKTEYADLWRPSLLVFSAVAATAGVAVGLLALRGPVRILPTAIALPFFIVAASASVFVLPVANEVKSARHFCAPVRQLTETTYPFRLFSVCFSREEYIFYANHDHIPVLTDILAVEPPAGMDFIAMAKQQKRLRDDIADAVQEVPINIVGEITDGELRELQNAIRHEIEGDKKLDHELAPLLQEALVAAIREFHTILDTPVPAFAFVQEEDWRWLVALYPDLREHTVIRAEQVGSRYVLLLANKAGVRLLRETGVDVAVPAT